MACVVPPAPEERLRAVPFMRVVVAVFRREGSVAVRRQTTALIVMETGVGKKERYRDKKRFKLEIVKRVYSPLF